MTVIRAPAKLNLRLAVLAREESGFHSLETLFCALELADTLELEPADGLELRVEGDVPGRAEDNLVHRAARAFYEAAGIEPAARIRLRKRIPAGAGLGGGSSDAAATLRALNRQHGEPLDRRALLGLGSALGSDVPFFLAGSPFALAWGRGERLLPLPTPPPAPVLLAVPEAGVSTAEAYNWLDRRRGREGRGAPRPALLDIDALRDWDGIAPAAVNHFEPAVFERRPELARLRTALAESGARFALLTGTGAAVFGVYADAARRDAAADELAARAPDVRLIRTRTAADPRAGGG